MDNETKDKPLFEVLSLLNTDFTINPLSADKSANLADFKDKVQQMQKNGMLGIHSYGLHPWSSRLVNDWWRKTIKQKKRTNLSIQSCTGTFALPFGRT